MNSESNLGSRLLSSKLIFACAAVILMGGFFAANPVKADVLSLQKDSQTIGVSQGSGAGWQDKNEAKVSDNNYARTEIGSDRNHDETSKYIRATDFGFNIPAGATISGIQVDVEKHQDHYYSLNQSDNVLAVKDNSVKIIKNGSNSGEEKATSDFWSHPADTTSVYGGVNDKWGLNWSPANINSSDFGIAISAKNVIQSGYSRAYIDYIKITVYYTPPCTPTTWYRDADQDTFGNLFNTTSSCTQPSGYVANSSDCSDNNAAVYPGATETCNNIDDNCNGAVDEDLGIIPADIVLGACSNNVKECVGGIWSDSQSNYASAPETCNSIDDDCDGVVDEDLGIMPADNQQGACANNVEVCDGGAWVNSQNNYTPTEESCNIVDDDCNGLVDEFLTQPAGDFGACSGNMATCALGLWVDNFEVVPSAEVCDADRIDENCDGSANEGCACDEGQIASCYGGPQGTEGVGICQSGTQTCDAGGQWGFCEGAQYSDTEVCDGLDNDCDGLADEDLETMPADILLGACSNNIKVCAQGSWLDSEINYVPAEETCSDIDDDCDGQINEDLDCAAPQVVSAVATASDTVKITFDEELQNNEDGHHPSTYDFRVYRGNDTPAIEISSVVYADKVVTLTLAEPLAAGDDPTYQVLPAATTIVDLAGNMVMSTISGSITDSINPVITLNGEATITLEFGAAYVEQGAVCSDVFGADLFAMATGTVDTNIAGTYSVKYFCSDAAGNKADEVFRTVIVNAKPAAATNDNGGNATLGGSSYYPPSSCASVVYGEWGTCTNGVQYRDVLSLKPGFCQMTADQQAVRSQTCGTSLNTGGQVLGVKVYPVGSLLRTPDKKIFVVLEGNMVKHITTLKELAAYRGQVIYNVSNETLAQYKQVLGAKIYADGTLLRGPDHKIYVILNGKKVHILNLAELMKYAGHKIYDVSAEILAAY